MQTRAVNRRVIGVISLLALIALLVAVTLRTPPDEAQAQTIPTAFLRIDGILGESANAAHQDEIEVRSWRWGESNSTRPLGGVSGSGKVAMDAFDVTMNVSRASPQLFLAAAQGRIIPRATLEVVRPGGNGETYLTWQLKNVVISSYETGTDSGSGVLTDRIKMRFTQITVTYTTQNPDGSAGEEVKAGWDLEDGKPI